eukprot:TRINITY_DN1103_c0_g1_i1.p1 TRINITY_DN1103_c0_g1~~TRINITY_DN1103_c0_g1_i1.p1  ORF type:complete len:640 (-),score=184.89 TRINITY_DN1103_c0_g1_i1:164-2083(-)
MSKYVPPHLRAGAPKAPAPDAASAPQAPPARREAPQREHKESDEPAGDRYRAPHQRGEFNRDTRGGDRSRDESHQGGDRYRPPVHREGHHEDHRHHGGHGHYSSSHQRESPTTMAQSTRNKFYHERKLHFVSERGRLFVGKGRRNVLSIVEKTGVKEIDVPVGKGVITIRGTEKDGVEKAVVRCAARLAQVELKEKSQEPVVYLHPITKTDDVTQLYTFEQVTLPNTTIEHASDKYYRIKQLSPSEVAEFEKAQEKQKKEADDFWKLTFGSNPPPTLANQEVVEEKHYYITAAHILKFILTKALEPTPANVELSCAFGQHVFINIPEETAKKVFTLMELHALLEKERFKSFFRWGVQQQDVVKIQKALDALLKNRTEKIVKKEISIKELTVVESDIDGHHYSHVKIQYFPEAQKPKAPESPVATEQVEAQKKKKKKKKPANPNSDFQQVVSRRKKGKGEETEAKPEEPEVPKPDPLQGLEYVVFNNREAIVNICMIGLPLDVQFLVGDGSSSKYTPGQTMKQFADSLQIDASSKLAPPAGSDQSVIQGQNSVLYIEKSNIVSTKNYVFEPENFTLQIKVKEQAKDKDSAKEKESSLNFISTLPKGLLPPDGSTTVPAESLTSTFTPLINRLSMLSKLLV